MIITGTGGIIMAAATTDESDWWTWLNANYTVVGAYDFRSAASLADATKIGSTPSIVNQPGGGLNITAAGLVCAADTALDTGIDLGASGNTASFIVLFSASASFFMFGAYDPPLYFATYYTPPPGSSYAANGTPKNFVRAESTGTIAAGGAVAYSDGVSVGAISAAGDTSSVPSLAIGAFRRIDDYYALGTGTIAAVAITSDTISEADMATLHTMMSA